MCQVSKLKQGYKRCDEQKIHLTIIFKGENVDLCEACWRKISDTNLEWGKEIKGEEDDLDICECPRCHQDYSACICGDEDE